MVALCRMRVPCAAAAPDSWSVTTWLLTLSSWSDTCCCSLPSDPEQRGVLLTGWTRRHLLPVSRAETVLIWLCRPWICWVSWADSCWSPASAA